MYELEETWKKALAHLLEAEWAQVVKNVRKEYRTKTVFPDEKNIFHAFDLTPFEKAQVVILGQDPYCNGQEAHGLCFSVPQGVALPPSLKNIFKEIEKDLGRPAPVAGDLTRWGEQGVFLLNSSLTVVQENRQDKRASHRKTHERIWKKFTDGVIKTISDKKDGVVFMLWGKEAQKKRSIIDGGRHRVLTAAHPSPQNWRGGFSGCKHFSKANEYLRKRGRSEIEWWK